MTISDKGSLATFPCACTCKKTLGVPILGKLPPFLFGSTVRIFASNVVGPKSRLHSKWPNSGYIMARYSYSLLSMGVAATVCVTATACSSVCGSVWVGHILLHHILVTFSFLSDSH